MIRGWARAWLGAAAACLLVTACAVAPAISGPPPSAPPGGAVIVAKDLAFDVAPVEIPADVAVPLLFENRDSVPHNVTILDGADPTLFVGETFTGPGSRVYTLPPIAAGRYPFRCDVHTSMTGTLIVGPNAAPSGS